MAQETITINLNTAAQTAGVQKILTALGLVKSTADGTQSRLNQVSSAITGSVGRMVAGTLSVTAAVAGLGLAVRRGVSFNKTLEDSILGIAAVFKQFNPSSFKTFDDAMRASAAAVELLKQKAKESPSSFSQLVESFQAITGAASSARIQIKDQVELVVLMSQALAGLGIRSEQLIQESRALITGNINEDAAAARILGITKAQIDQAKDQGRLFEFLQGKLAAFSEAGKVGAGNFSVAISNLGDVIEQKLGAITVPIFEAIKEGALSLTHTIDGAGLERVFEGWARGLAKFTRAIFDVASFGVKHIGALTNALEALALVLSVVAARAALLFALPIVGWLGQVGGSFRYINTMVNATSRLSGVIAGLGAALTIAGGPLSIFLATLAGWSMGPIIGEIEIFGVKVKDFIQLPILQALLAWEKFKIAFGGGMASAFGLSKGSPAVAKELEQSIQEMFVPPSVRQAPTPANLSTTGEPPKTLDDKKHEQLLLERNAAEIERLNHNVLLSEEAKNEGLQEAYTQRLMMLGKMQKELEEKMLQEPHEFEGHFTERYASLLKQLIPVQQEFNEALEGTYKTKLKIAQAGQEMVDNEIEQSELQLDQLRTRGSKSGGRTVGNMGQEEGAIQAQIEQLQGLIQKRQELNQAMRDSGLIQEQEYKRATIANEKALQSLQQEWLSTKEQLNDFSFFEKLSRNLDDLTNQFNHFGAAVADVLTNGIGNAIRAVSQGIWQVIDGTATWGEIFMDVGRQIISGLIEIAIQEIILDNLKRALAWAWFEFKTAMGWAGVAETTAQVETEVGIHAAGEASKTSSTIAGAFGRGLARLGETIWHGILVGIRVAKHIAGEALMTAVTVAQSALRIASVVAETLVSLILAAIKAMSAVASIPYVGPFLAIAALAAIIAAGMGAMGAFEKGGVVEGGEQVIRVNESGPEAVLNADATARLGRSRIDALNNGALISDFSDLEYRVADNVQPPGRDAWPMRGGMENGGGGGQAITISMVLVDSRNSQATTDFLQSSSGETLVVEIVKNHKTEIGIKS